ncbi:Mitomycin radical oxidase [Gordonia paraffinivorans]|uniref:Mitomycin radical oxidase n=1 Tax=Gordonia paraffinivorans TaxID=175628 RepID=A0ABD7V147_9ACTN|nr:FAD-binding oxidoreductase [Gordonia paraffinivorans]VFA87945.1 Mitomycin radical oxidase [Gordonia paraffinivorans]
MNTTITSQPTDHISLGTLMSEVSGPVLTPTDEGYATELGGFNLIAAPAADLVVGATNADDVALAVRYARANGFRVGARATGHGLPIEGRGTVVVTTSRLNSITVDPVARTARVGAGVRWRDVVAATAPHGLTGVVGSSSPVGVVGYTLGGGLSPLGRRFGWAADHVRSIELVTADGVVRSVDASAGSDLFWAILGGRDGFGIVTAIEFELFDLPTVYGGGIFFAGSAARDVLHAWRDWAPTLPEEAGTSVAVLRLPPDPDLPAPLQGQLAVHVRYTHTGDPAAAAALLAPMRSAGPILLENVDILPTAALDAVHMDPADPMPSVERGVLLGEFPAAAVEALLEVAGPQVPIPPAIVEVRLLGGTSATAAARAERGRRTPRRLFRDRDRSAGRTARRPGGSAPAGGRRRTGAVAVRRAAELLRAPAADRAGLWGPDERLRLETIRRRHDPTRVLASR